MFLTSIIEIDQGLFELINVGFTNAFFDWLMPIMRSKEVWIPLYAFIVLFVYFNFDKWKATRYIFYLLMLVALADLTSSRLIKPTFMRDRPCHCEEIVELIERVPCGHGYSFTSSHAANHFAIALFLILSLGSIFPKIKWPLLIWASIISFAQVYVGVHYPSDVISGAILGSLLALVTWYLYKVNYRYVLS